VSLKNESVVATSYMV